MLTASGIRAFRILGGTTAALAGLIVLAACENEQSLALAVLLLGAFILGHLVIETTFQATRNKFVPPSNSDPLPGSEAVADPKTDGNGDRPAAEAEPQPDSGLREFASAFVSTSGVILGLLAVFGARGFSLTIKVGIGALVADILVGIVLVGLLISAPDQRDQQSWNLIRYVFNVALWALALGLLCIGTALLYR